jgi:hypothetical protein
MENMKYETVLRVLLKGLYVKERTCLEKPVNLRREPHLYNKPSNSMLSGHLAISQTFSSISVTHYYQVPQIP